MKRFFFFLLLACISFPSLFAQTYDWAEGVGSPDPGPMFSYSYGNSYDAGGNVYLSGHFQGTVDFDPQGGVYNLTAAGINSYFVQKLDAGKNLIWAVTFAGSATGYNENRSIISDAAGNTYITGAMGDGTQDMDPGPGVFNLTNAGVYDVFVVKLDPAGNFVWAVKVGDTGFDYAMHASLDGSGNVIISGFFQNTVDFDPGVGVFNLTGTSPAGLSQFILKLDISGNFIWAITTDAVEGICTSTDAAGNIYSTGSFEGTVDFDPGAGTFNLTANGLRDVYVQKLDAAGNFLWAVSFGDIDYDYGYWLKSDPAGNVYVSGYYTGPADLDPGAGVFVLPSYGGLDIFALKLDAAGNFVWAIGMGDGGVDIGTAIDFDAAGNVYLVGYFNGTVDFDPGAGSYPLSSGGGDDFFLEKLDPSGNFLWAYSWGAAGNDYVNCLTVEAAGSIYLSGFFSQTFDFDPTGGVDMISAQGYWDGFLIKLSDVVLEGSIVLTGERNGGTNKLNWESGEDCILQRQNESGVFTDVQSFSNVSAKRISFSYSDLSPLPGTNYYRVVETDGNGNVVYSNVVEIVTDPLMSNMLVYPNPVSQGELINVSFNLNEAGEIFFNLVDATGKEVYSITAFFPAGEQAVMVPTEGLAGSVYLAEVISQGGRLLKKVVLR